MPLTRKGEKILAHMKEEYGPERGTRVFYASERKGTISGVHAVLGKLGRRRAKKKRARKNQARGARR